MIGPTGAVRVMVATKLVDLRKGAEELAALFARAWAPIRSPARSMCSGRGAPIGSLRHRTRDQRLERKPPVRAASLSGFLASGTIGELGLDNGAGRMVCFEPDCGNVRHEAIRVERKPCGVDHSSLHVQKAGERLTMVYVECAALDAAFLRAELDGRETAGGCCGGDRFG